MRKAKKSVQGIWNEVLDRFWELRTDFGSAFIVIAHNRVARVLVIAFAAAAVVLALLWGGAILTSDRSAAQENSVTSTADDPHPFLGLLNNSARLQSQNAALKEQVDSLAAQNSELERQNGELSKKFSELSKPS